MYICKICNKEYEKKQAYAAHVGSHNRGESYKKGRRKEKPEKDHKCKFCGKEYENGWQLGGHQTLCSLNPDSKNKKEQFANNWGGRKHSEESKIKLSESRKKYLRENPDKHPWKKNSKFVSEPCEYLKNKLRVANIKFKEEFMPLYPNRYFSMDIAFPDKKLAIEVNGEQHYNRDGSLRKYYKQRHDLIEKSGWKIIELHYSEVYKDNIVKKLKL